jgi:putative flippase GtrA
MEERTAFSSISLRQRLHSLPEFHRFIIAGTVGLGLGWVVYQLLYLLNPLQELRATSTWMIAYLMGIFGQHALHRWLTFHDSQVAYWQSLRRAYLTYAGGLILTTAVNWVCVELVGLHHQVGWAIAMGSSLLFNYLALKFYVFRKT